MLLRIVLKALERVNNMKKSSYIKLLKRLTNWCFTKDGNILIATFSKGLDPCWFSNGNPLDYVIHDIVAFRKLPEPYNA